MTEKQLDLLETRLNYFFKDKARLKTALTHSSYANEQTDSEIEDNERYEFLGDAVLNLIVSHILMHSRPGLSEGDLSRTRAFMVNEVQLAEIARKINLGDFIELGKGELQTNGRNKNSILADAFEAVCAAVYLDGGFEQALEIITSLFAPILEKVSEPQHNRDYKSRLQELAQTWFRKTPVYSVIDESGPDHNKTFTVQLIIDEIKASGTGKSKKAAEQDAARKALEMLDSEQ